MSTYASLHYHIVFSTKERQRLIDASWQPRLHEYLGGTVRKLGGFPQGIGGVQDHVHLLVGLKTTHCIADFMRELKLIHFTGKDLSFVGLLGRFESQLTSRIPRSLIATCLG